MLRVTYFLSLIAVLSPAIAFYCIEATDRDDSEDVSILWISTETHWYCGPFQLHVRRIRYVAMLFLVSTLVQLSCIGTTLLCATTEGPAAKRKTLVSSQAVQQSESDEEAF